MALYDVGPKSKRERAEQTVAKMTSLRKGGGFDSHWQELSDWLQPRRSRFWVKDRNRGDKRNQNIIDSTGRFALRTFKDGIRVYHTSPTVPWMQLSTPDPDLAEHREVKPWLHVTTKRMLTVFAQTNLYRMLTVLYGDWGLFATGAMAVVSDDKDLFRCYTYPIGSYCLGADGRGNVGTFSREYELSVRQVVEQFGVVAGTRDIDWTRISSVVKNCWDRGDYEDGIAVTWLVQPNDDANPNRLGATYLPIASYHFETQSKEAALDKDKFLRESGFKTFPIMAPRFEITGEDAYGTDCPGMTALGDVRQLQMMQRRKAQLVEKAVYPTMVGPPSIRNQKTSLLAGDITYDESVSRGGGAGLRPIHEVRLEGYQHLRAETIDVAERIKEAFYTPLFQMLKARDEAGQSAQMTAREVAERHDEKQILGALVDGLGDEVLEPLVDRVFLMMQDAGLIPPPPPILEGVKLKVEFTSILAQAQKLIGVSGLGRVVASTLPLAEAFPSVTEKIDINQVIEDYQDMLSVDPRVIRSSEEVEARMAARAQQQQQAQQAEEMKNMAAAAAQAGAKPIAPDSALDRVLQETTQ